MSTLKVSNIENPSTSSGGIDIDTSGHVTVDGVAMPSAGPLSNRNLIINGNFAINQRGGTNSAINTYTLDRWRSYGGPMGFTISQQNVLASLSTSKYAIRFQRTSGNTQTNNTGIVQGIESKNCEGLAGTQLTLSFKARKGANLSDDLEARLFYGTGTDENPVSMTGMTNDGGTDFTLTTSFAAYTKTVTVPSGTTQISVAFSVTPTGTAGANDWFEVAEVQLERGSVATPFEHRSYADELARCQRYLGGIDTRGQSAAYHHFGVYTSDGTTGGMGNISFAVPMRQRATKIYASAANKFWGYSCTGFTSIAYDQAGINSAAVVLLGGSGGTAAGTAGRFLANNTTDAYILFESEL